jgi:uncharacterized protein YcfL
MAGSALLAYVHRSEYLMKSVSLLLATALAAAPAFAGNDVDVSSLRSLSAENGLFRVQAELANRAEEPRQLFYRFRWIDQNGFAAWEDEAWKPLTIYGKQRLLVSTVAPVAAARNYSLELFEQP